MIVVAAFDADDDDYMMMAMMANAKGRRHHHRHHQPQPSSALELLGDPRKDTQMQNLTSTHGFLESGDPAPHLHMDLNPKLPQNP